MRIRTGRSVAAPTGAGASEAGGAEEPRVRAGRPSVDAAGPRVRMVKMAQAPLSASQISETTMLFRDFLAHLDRLGLDGPAAHVSLGFDRFCAIYRPDEAA